MSVVYLALDQTLGTEHALKIVFPDSIEHNSSVARRFLIQAKEAFTIRHPNVVSVTESGLIDNSMPFLVMDFVKGASLKEVLSRRSPLRPSEALEFVSAIGHGLAFAHARGVVHGDLKPRNILVEQERPIAQAIKITDFGLSAIKSGKVHGPTQGKGSGVLRSPVYLAPEEWSEDESDTRSDIYSLGVILYQMLTGEVPFKGKSIPAIMKSHLTDTPPPISGRFDEISSDVERVVLHALEKDPVNRPPTVERFVEEFRLALLNESNDSVDLEKTIVLPTPLKGPAAVDSYSEVDADLRQPQDFEATIVHGLTTNDLAEAEGQFEVEAQRASGAMQPILLAVGVVLVIVLIGIGVYYSRTSQ